MPDKPYRPQNKTILKVVSYLEKELGLSVYGQHTDLETGGQITSLMDFSAANIIKFRKLVEADGLRRKEE